MSLLSSMPYEIFEIIFSAASQHDRACFTRLNRWFHEFAEPLLYRSIERKHYTEVGFRFIPICLLFCTIIQRPRLAELVRHINLVNNVTTALQPLSNLPARFHMQPENIEAFVKIAEDLNFPSTELWKNLEYEMLETYTASDFGTAEALAPILTAQLSNLRSLDLESQWEGWDYNDPSGVWFNVPRDARSKPK